MRLRTADGRVLTYDQVGRGPLLACHPGGPGFPGRHLGTLGTLAERAELVRLDPRGTGGSDPAGDYSIGAYAADVDELGRHLGLERLALFGHSHGGFVAVRYAATRPAAVAGLVLDGTPLRVADVRFPADGVAGYFHRFDDAARRYVDDELSSPWAPAGEHFMRHEAPRVDVTDELRAVTAPCLVVFGEDDFATGPAVAAAMAELLPRGEVAVIRDAGHFAWVEQPEAYGEVVGRFVRSLGAGG